MSIHPAHAHKGKRTIAQPFPFEEVAEADQYMELNEQVGNDRTDARKVIRG
jgi:hypothetical protein